MERLLVAKLDNGMDSFLRVLSTLRNKRINIQNVSLEENDLIIKLDESIYNEVRLFLSNLVDIKLQ